MHIFLSEVGGGFKDFFGFGWVCIRGDNTRKGEGGMCAREPGC